MENPGAASEASSAYHNFCRMYTVLAPATEVEVSYMVETEPTAALSIPPLRDGAVAELNAAEPEQSDSNNDVYEGVDQPSTK